MIGKEAITYRIMVHDGSGIDPDTGKQGRFVGNGVRYPVQADAVAYARDLGARWSCMCAWRIVVASGDNTGCIVARSAERSLLQDLDYSGDQRMTLP